MTFQTVSNETRRKYGEGIPFAEKMTTKRAIVPARKGRRLDGSSTALAVASSASAAPVPHWGVAEVRRIAEAAGAFGRNGERDRLLVVTLADACLRVTELVGGTTSGGHTYTGLRPCDIVRAPDGGCRVRIVGKGKKPGEAAISRDLAAELFAYCYNKNVGREDRIFPIIRQRAHQIVTRAIKTAGISKLPDVGAVHMLRHSGALIRLMETKNPRAIQEQLRHSTPFMTLRYWRTLQAEESMKILEAVNLDWSKPQPDLFDGARA